MGALRRVALGGASLVRAQLNSPLGVSLLHVSAKYEPNLSPAYAGLRVEPAAPRPSAVLIDVCGTLLVPSESTSAVYQRYAAKHGVHVDEQDVLTRFRW